MKNPIKSFVSFTRTERAGLMALSALLAVLIAVRASMSLWVHPPRQDEEQEKRLVEAWEKFKRSQPVLKTSDTPGITRKDFQDAFDDNETPLPDTIDVNTADSATLVRLKGIGPVTAHRIVDRRKNKGPFTSIEQLREAGVFNRSTFELLKKHLTVGNNKQTE